MEKEDIARIHFYITMNNPTLPEFEKWWKEIFEKKQEGSVSGFPDIAATLAMSVTDIAANQHDQGMGVE
ncbi:hypothetical protein A3H53_02655 [Candidatus Nomurabacteria bacterium RIFCSPLOWO2_02_FULL_40_10]|uniref:Uncharacterized protein n=2 Tax=Candidatus Nomuraibacteriota TaxID=1752729 RepID=A0A1F6Y0N5_9BACT|nr:MAG: hypothetical protein A2642_04270 [Candidatus Nomurabacteria bacterium RIFCSPHIGHO2_01_FULL_39_10]OGI99904.1 MAG: hypothetical protein A3H53_02655 [Candidatus Nomurabacteria bacterium RIFCSPLOWO2_02_FULL_40_10]